MRIRYSFPSKGKRTFSAHVYDINDHAISRERLSLDARKVISRLQQYGYEAYVVGGAVRDLLLQKSPKDFDVVTDASPKKVRSLFRNSFIIGKRFRLVHVIFTNSTVEVSTFRAQSAGNYNNHWGTMKEDVFRRDFTLNALYYSPKDETIVDYVQGYIDSQKKIIRPVIPLPLIFVEDPVRIIRAIKYSVQTEFRLASSLRRALKKSVALLQEVSSSRLLEEFLKILRSGYSADIFLQFLKLGIFPYFTPNLSQHIPSIVGVEGWIAALRKHDEWVRECSDRRENHILPRGILTFTREALPHSFSGTEKQNINGVIAAMKQLISPLTPPASWLKDAARHYLMKN